MTQTLVPGASDGCRAALIRPRLRRLPGDRTQRELHPWTVVGRLCTCTSCGGHVDLVEIPEPWIDEEQYGVPF